MRFLKVLLSILVVSLLVASCSPKLPKAEVDSANAAFAAARTAQAEVLAADSFKAANDANDRLQANLNAKDYGKTTALAKSLSDAAAKASADAAVGLEAAKAEVAQLAADIGAGIPATQKLYAKAVARKAAAAAAKVDLKAMKAGLAAAPKALAAATDLAATDVVGARTQLAALKASLEGYTAALAAVGIKL